jgi:hypothetical protein
MTTKVDEAGGLFPPSKYYAFFRLLTEKMKFKTAVVLGVCGGGDCFHLCLGNPDGKVIGVDIQYDHPEQMKFIEANCPNFIFMQSKSVDAAERIYKEHGPIEFLFIDTDHTLGLARAEFHAYRPYLTKHAVVCFDDLLCVDMKGVWESIPTPKQRFDFLHDGVDPLYGGGFGVHLNMEESPLIQQHPEYEMGC